MNGALPDTSQLKRAQLVPVLVEAALKVISECGVDEPVQGMKGTVRLARSGDLQLLLRAQDADIAGAPSEFGIEIWYRYKKSLSVCWNSNFYKDYKVVLFTRGPWISELVKRAQE
jgi:hypothetical protein